MTNVSPIRICLREVREAKGLTQVELSESSGVRRATISDIERGTSRIDLETLDRLANALGVPAAVLIEQTPR
jgi:transcriptional regulator with XRE-family HTH domain